MFRDFLPFFFSPLYFFLPLIRAPTPFTDLVLLTRRRGISRQTIFASFFFLPRIKNEKGSGRENVFEEVRVENAHTWTIRGMTKRRNSPRFIRASSCLKNSETLLLMDFILRFVPR